MKTNDLITLFENILPQDLVFQNSENLIDKAKDDFLEVRRFLLEDAARSYFNLFIRPIIAKQIEMFSLGSNATFISSCLYNETTMKKYISMLEPNDELNEKYRIACENNNLHILNNMNLI